MTCWHYLAAGLIAGIAIATVITTFLWAACTISGRPEDAGNATPFED
jgi:hypothetical protein